MFYLWRMTDAENWMVLDSTKYPPDSGTELYAFHAQAKAEADKRNRARQDAAQGELGV